jgi:hypothetical protein
MSDLMRRLGRFSIRRDHINDNPGYVLQHQLSGMLVVRAEYLYWSNCIEYTAAHPSFDLLKECEEPPCYMAEWSLILNEEAGVATQKLRWVRFQ